MLMRARLGRDSRWVGLCFWKGHAKQPVLSHVFCWGVVVVVDFVVDGDDDSDNDGDDDDDDVVIVVVVVVVAV